MNRQVILWVLWVIPSNDCQLVLGVGGPVQPSIIRGRLVKLYYEHDICVGSHVMHNDN